MCKYCVNEDGADLSKGRLKFGILGSLYVYNTLLENEIVVHIMPEDGMKSYWKTKKINYCPMCGRKLNGDTDNA